LLRLQESINCSPSPANLLDKVVCHLQAGRSTGAAPALPPLGSLPLPLLPLSLSLLRTQLVSVTQLASSPSSSEDASPVL
jgi:hypothetical protein